MSRYKSPIRTPQEWKYIVQDFYRSGLSSSEFCKLHDINIKTFSNNRRKFSELIEPPTEAPFIEVSKPDTEERTEPKLHRKSGALPSLCLETGDCRLHIPTSVTPAWIAELLREVAK